MLKNFFINSIRNIRKHAGYTFLNIAGLTIGITSFLLIVLYVFHELSYDRFHKNYRNTYRIKISGIMAGSTLDQAVTAAPMSAALKKDYPVIENAVRLREYGAWLVKYGDKKFNEDGIFFADSSFFRVFDFTLLKGDRDAALTNPRSIVLTRKFASKYFGNEDPIGKRLSLEADTNLYTITGIMEDIPSNSHIKFDMLASLNSIRSSQSQEWISHNFYTYIILKEGTGKEAMEAHFPEVVEKYVGPQIKAILGITIEEFRASGSQFNYVLEPLKDIHLRGATQYAIEPSGSLTMVYIFTLIAVLILLIAIINYVNLATAKSTGRAKEVGIKKVSGSHKAGLIMQFIGESVLMTAIATILASLVAIVLIPYFDQLVGKEIETGMFSGKSIVFALVMLAIVTGMAAGFYPAFVLSSFNPAIVLKGTMNPGQVSKKLRGILVVFQFTVSMVIIIGAFTVHRQLKYMTSSDMGLKKENLLVIRRPDVLGNKIDMFKQQLLGLPGIESVANSVSIPGKKYSNNGFLLDDDPTKTTYLINQDQVSIGYPETMGISLAEGRYFSKDYNDSLSILLNEEAVKYLGLKDPLGKYILQPARRGTFTKRRIVGIMKDFNIESLHNRITPVCFTVMPGNFEGYICVRLRNGDINGTIRSIENSWKEFTNRQPFQYSFFDEEFNRLYQSEFRTGRLFIIFSVLAIIIACLGLIGMITYMTNIRTREIGIRKTFGGTGMSVVKLFSMEVMYLIVISSILAYPAAYFAAKMWLDTFAEKVNISPVVFIISSLICLAIGLASILFQTLKAAGTNPAESLRYK